MKIFSQASYVLGSSIFCEVHNKLGVIIYGTGKCLSTLSHVSVCLYIMPHINLLSMRLGGLADLIDYACMRSQLSCNRDGGMLLLRLGCKEKVALSCTPPLDHSEGSELPSPCCLIASLPIERDIWQETEAHSHSFSQ